MAIIVTQVVVNPCHEKTRSHTQWVDKKEKIYTGNHRFSLEDHGIFGFSCNFSRRNHSIDIRRENRNRPEIAEDSIKVSIDQKKCLISVWNNGASSCRCQKCWKHTHVGIAMENSYGKASESDGKWRLASGNLLHRFGKLAFMAIFLFNNGHFA